MKYSNPYAWDKYLMWNDAVVDHFFQESRAGEPVYLDMEDSVFHALASQLDLPVQCAEPEFQAAIHAVLQRHSGPVFRHFDRELTRWWLRLKREKKLGFGSQDAPAPPVVGLLALTARAAELQGTADLGAGAHDSGFYSHLTSLLMLPQSEHGRVSAAIRHSSENWWDSLAYWLELHDGRFGLPSAAAFSYRYVGLPTSQALIREADIPRLHRMFRQFDLEPGGSVSPEDMAVMLREWCETSHDLTANLRRLLENESARQQVADIAVVELSTWTPEAPEDEPNEAGEKRPGRVQLAYWSQRRKLRQRTLHFGALMQGTEAADGWILQTEDSPIQLTVDQATPTAVAFTAEDVNINKRSLLEGQLDVTDPVGRNHQRVPRPVIIFSRSESIQGFLETPRAQLGREISILVRHDRNLVSRVKSLLTDCAEPGFVHSLAGHGSVPEGWDIFEKVVLLRPPSPTQTGHGLDMLAPLTSLSVEFNGGLRLPGRIARWSYTSKPSMTVTASESLPVSVRLEWMEVESDGIARRTKVLADKAEPPLTLEVPADIPCRDFTVVASQASGSAVREIRRSLRLKRGDDRDARRWSQRPGLAHLDMQRGVISAELLTAEIGDDDVIVKGARVEAFPADTTNTVPGTDLPWKDGRNQLRQATARPHVGLPVPDPTSCLVTGAHRFLLPPTPRKRSKRAVWIYKGCSQCGLTKRHLLDPGNLKTRGPMTAQEMPRYAPLTRTMRHAVGREEIQDLMVHLGYGTMADLRYMARETDLDASDLHEMVRDLESTGFLEIRRDENMRAVDWEINDPVLVEFRDGVAAVGGWSESQLERLIDLSDGRVPTDEGAPTVVRVTDLSQLADDLVPETVYCGSAEVLVDCLPPLSEALAGFPQIPLPSPCQELDWFSVGQAAWIAVDGIGTAGLYRDTSGWITQHYLVVDDVTCLRVDKEFGKHAAAALERRALISYDAEAEELRVPLGARLPGLYERAVVLSTFALPRSNKQRRSIVYPNVDIDLAAALTGKMV
ncbi:hypothetical protein [Kocuria rosea]|uniref:hypothetical protein n=1 Tax=Kocuria rosea TaxID=1275 RepID=UPI0012F884D9|nr:hypothetical protein [Kocuria polaris]